eukprot:SAG11_NODE_1281_length_5311_cov_4.192441_2_plen_218_part_00
MLWSLWLLPQLSVSTAPLFFESRLRTESTRPAMTCRAAFGRSKHPPIDTDSNVTPSMKQLLWLQLNRITGAQASGPAMRYRLSAFMNCRTTICSKPLTFASAGSVTMSKSGPSVDSVVQLRNSKELIVGESISTSCWYCTPPYVMTQLSNRTRYVLSTSFSLQGLPSWLHGPGGAPRRITLGTLWLPELTPPSAGGPSKSVCSNQICTKHRSSIISS